MTSRRRHAGIVLRLLIVLLAGLELPAGLSICVAEDGHATIEVAHAELPCTSHLERHHPDDAVEANHLGAHPCRDLPFLETSVRRDASSSRLLQAVGGLTSWVGLRLPTTWQIAAHLSSPSAHHDSSGTRRNVVLLI
jgi:hypothetical protein